MFKTLQWEDWAGILIGAWMLVSPWVLGYSDQYAATMNALILGAVLVVEAFLNLDVHNIAEEGLDLVAGLWLVISPFVLGFASTTPAALNAVAAGLLSVLFAGWALSPLDEKMRFWWREHMTRH